MTRFMMTLEEAVELVLFAFQNGNPGDIFIQKSPASEIGNLVKAVKEVMGVSDYEEKVIGTRHGEKLFEVLVSREEMTVSKDLGKYYRIPADERDLNYSTYVDSGDKELSSTNEYTSHNTKQLSLEEMIDLINKVDLKSLDY